MWGSQVYKALFFIMNMKSYMDEEIADALAESYESKQYIIDWYDSAYRKFSD